MSSVASRHYKNPQVQNEIYRFTRNRWAALEGAVGGARVFIRYHEDRPLTISSPVEVEKLVNKYSRLGARTFYATIHTYRSLASSGDPDDLGNIASTTVFLDIDSSLEKWELTISAAEEIVSFLEKNGVDKSVYVLWSGEGAHVRIHEGAFSRELLSRYHPLDIAFAVAEFVVNSLKDKLESLSEKAGGELRVENLIDIKRVFTAPLSLHRRRDVIAVCLKPNDLASFDLSWLSTDNFRHNPAWSNYEEGEADELALKAFTTINKAKTSMLLAKATRIGASAERKPKTKRLAVTIGRFQVMGLLQAARHYLLMGDLDKAKSFGLNRAIFYAWAKHYGKGYVPRNYRPEPTSIQALTQETDRRLVEVFGEPVYVSRNGYYIIGDKEQTPEDFDKNIKSKIEEVMPFELAWEAALKYVSMFPETVLRDPRRFYEEVYEKVRDSFIEKVVREFGGGEQEKTSANIPESHVRAATSEKPPGERKTLMHWLLRSEEEGKRSGSQD